MQSFDPIYLQRLVDGELDRHDTRKLLQMAETNPHLWRQMASAFVENQLWQDDFCTIDRGDSTINQIQATDRPNQTSSKFLYLLSLAAGILLSLTAGILIGRNSGSWADDGNLQMANNGGLNALDGLVPDQPLAGQSKGERTLVDYKPDYHLELEDANGNPYFGSEVPLYSATNAQKAGIRLDRPSQIPREFVDRVNRNGYGIQQNLNYISGRLNDGRQFVVPVRTINLSPGQ